MRALSSRLGIFAKTFRRATAAEVADEVRRAGYTVAHWNFSAIGMPTLADGIAEETFGDVRAAFDTAGLSIPSVSATYNVIGPEAQQQTRKATALIRRARLLGADVVTLCSGTRDPEDMWRAHLDNASAAAWRELRATLDVLLEAAADGGVVLGIEPEPGNVVRDAATAARLLHELGDGAPVGIVFDPANLLTPETLAQQERILTEAANLLTPETLAQQERILTEAANLLTPETLAQQERILTEAVDLLGPRVVGVQAKGFGVMDYDLVFRLLERVPPVPLIVQDVTEADADRVRRDLLRGARR